MSKRQWDWHSVDIPDDLVEAIRPYTKSTKARMQAMFNCLQTVDRQKIIGDIVECGVWRGGNVMMARRILPDRIAWLYDTFDGMTVPDPLLDVKPDGERAIDRYNLKKNGGTKWDAVEFDEVVDYFKTLGLIDNTVWIKGPVEFTLLASVPPERIAVLRLDMDWHLPTKVALDVLYPHLVPGGFLIVDDYGHWVGCRKAVDEYFINGKPPMKEIDYTCVVFRKC